MIGPLDMVMLLSGQKPLSRPEALHLASLVWPARLQEAALDGSRLIDRQTSFEITPELALKMGPTRVEIQEAIN